MVRKANATADEYLALVDTALVAQCEVDNYRASGPGGQKRNKTSSAVRLRHRPTGLIVVAEEERSQHVNRTRAIRRLREAIALRIRGRVDPERYAPSELFSSCLDKEGRLRVNRRNHRYFHVVSEMLDVLAVCGTRVSDAARMLGMSTAHLVKFIQKDSNLWERVNQMRAAAGVKPLR